MQPISSSEHRPNPSELVLNPDGSVYHLGLRPEDIGERVLLVGDPERVEQVSGHFDEIELERRKREFITRTGSFRGERLSVLSTGIGTDNIDIVVNELDALMNFDLEEGVPLEEPRSLDLIRIGTSGALQRTLPVDSFLLSEMALGMDGVMHAYAFEESKRERGMREAFEEKVEWPAGLARPYFAEADPTLLEAFGAEFERGITVTAHGFYGLQGRSLRLPLATSDLNDRLSGFEHEGLRVTNFEMESSALFGLASSLGHRACTACLIIANRYAGRFSSDHHKGMDRLIRAVLEVGRPAKKNLGTRGT